MKSTCFIGVLVTLSLLIGCEIGHDTYDQDYLNSQVGGASTGSTTATIVANTSTGGNKATQGSYDCSEGIPCRVSGGSTSVVTTGGASTMDFATGGAATSDVGIGGTPATGGQLATGGTSAATGGQLSTGGASTQDVGIGGRSTIDVATGGSTVILATGGAAPEETGGASTMDFASGGTSAVELGTGGASTVDVSTGGAASATGGQPATGGASTVDVATGGQPATGGASTVDLATGGTSTIDLATGGKSATGGQPSTGGTSSATGGMAATGGSSSTGGCGQEFKLYISQKAGSLNSPKTRCVNPLTTEVIETPCENGIYCYFQIRSFVPEEEWLCSISTGNASMPRLPAKESTTGDCYSAWGTYPLITTQGHQALYDEDWSMKKDESGECVYSLIVNPDCYYEAGVCLE